MFHKRARPEEDSSGGSAPGGSAPPTPGGKAPPTPGGSAPPTPRPTVYGAPAGGRGGGAPIAPQGLWDQRVAERAHYGSVLVQRAFDYDAYVRITQSRDSLFRRRFVTAIKTFLQQKYKHALENPECPLFRQQFERFFTIVRGDSQICNILQTYICHLGVLFEANIKAWLCPPPPDPDDPNAVDTAYVDRTAFALFEQQHLLPMFYDLRDGSTITVPSFVRELNAAYSALMPPDPLEAALANPMRAVQFSDDEAIARMTVGAQPPRPPVALPTQHPSTPFE